MLASQTSEGVGSPSKGKTSKKKPTLVVGLLNRSSGVIAPGASLVLVPADSSRAIRWEWTKSKKPAAAAAAASAARLPAGRKDIRKSAPPRVYDEADASGGGLGAPASRAPPSRDQVSDGALTTTTTTTGARRARPPPRSTRGGRSGRGRGRGGE
jgi:hypothetical protein